MLERAKNMLKTLSPGVKTINFTGFGLENEDLVVLKPLMQEKEIEEVFLTSNNLSRPSANTLVEINSLKRIHVGCNNFGNEGAKILLSKRGLEFVDLSDNNLTVKVAATLKAYRAQGVVIQEHDNPRLEKNYPSQMDDFPALYKSETDFPSNKQLTPVESSESVGGILAKLRLPSMRSGSASQRTDDDEVYEKIKALIETCPEENRAALFQKLELLQIQHTKKSSPQ